MHSSGACVARFGAFRDVGEELIACAVCENSGGRCPLSRIAGEGWGGGWGWGAKLEAQGLRNRKPSTSGSWSELRQGVVSVGVAW